MKNFGAKDTISPHQKILVSNIKKLEGYERFGEIHILFDLCDMLDIEI